MRRIVIALIIAVVGIAAIAAIAVPNLSEAMNRSRQKRTMADMRTIATAWEARATDVNSYAIGKKDVTAAELARVLEPKYVRTLPRVDAWASEFVLSIADQGQTYAIRSLGSDRRADGNPNLSGVTTKFSDDIVFSNGAFVRYPESAG